MLVCCHKIGHNNSINTLYLYFFFRHCRLYPLFSIYGTINIEQKRQLTIDAVELFMNSGAEWCSGSSNGV